MKFAPFFRVPLPLAVFAFILLWCEASLAADAARPNILFILADDLGYGDVGCYGQTKIRTPHIDRLAAVGMRFTDAYAGATICSPSRSVLMTGQHTGHTRIRGNMAPAGGMEGRKGNRTVRRMHLTENDRTIGNVLRDAGYKTAAVGKWHLDGFNPTAGPLDRGFDIFHGWLVSTPSTYSPTYYPRQRFRNRDLVDVPENQDGHRGYYHADMCVDEAIDFLNEPHERPFFLYVAFNLPHSPLDAPDFGPYADEPWPEPMKTYAAMVHYLDECVGKLMAALQSAGLDEDTVVFFCSDNGPRSEPSAELTAVVEFFESRGPLRGYKRDLSEGGIRVPVIARWPGRIAAGVTSAKPWYFPDVLPTAAALAGAMPPDGIDGVSILPTLLGEPQDLSDRFMYWEDFEGGFKQAVRWRQWKAIRSTHDAPLELFDIESDLGETHDVAADHPAVVARFEQYLAGARTESENWPLR